MSKRSLALAGVLALSGVFVASAKSYDIMLSNPTKAGTTLLRAGEYRLTLEGSNAVFINSATGKKFTAPVRIETDPRKHEQTAVDTTSQKGINLLTAIELGGSTQTLEFVN